MDTALGNCLTMIALCSAALRITHVSKWDLLNDGDDVLVIVEETEAANLPLLLGQAMLAMGIVCDPEWCPGPLESVVFCRSQPVLLGSGWSFVRWPQRVVGTLLVSHKHYHEPLHGLSMMKAMAACELACSRGVPCVQPLCLAILDALVGVPFPSSSEGEDFFYRASLESRHPFRAQPKVITPTARVSFAAAFNIDVSAQMAFEAGIKKIDLAWLSHSVGSTVDAPPDGLPQKDGAYDWFDPEAIVCQMGA
jgi:hypothetical protein